MDMNEDERDSELNRRDFLKGGSAATIMTMLGGTQLLSAAESASEGPCLKSYRPLRFGPLRGIIGNGQRPVGTDNP